MEQANVTPDEMMSNSHDLDQDLRYRILLYGDFRSPHAQGMASGLREAGNKVMCVSSEVVGPEIAVSPANWISRRRSSLVENMRDSTRTRRRRVLRLLSNSALAQAVLALALLPARWRLLNKVVKDFSPDIIHGLRLPYEGLTILGMSTSLPRVVSTWGIDFEPTASRNFLLRWWMRLLLPRTDGIHIDSVEDYNRALSFGLKTDAPNIFAAGNFGIDRDLFHSRDSSELGLVVFARRPVPSVNYRAFVGACMQLQAQSGLRFVGTNLLEVEHELLEEFGPDLSGSIELLPRLGRIEFAELIRKSHVVVSPALADGTPNTVLEALATRSRVVAGRLPQLEALGQRADELVLVDPLDATALAIAIKSCVEDGLLAHTPELPREFDRVANKLRFSLFYRSVLEKKRSERPPMPRF